MVTSEEFHFQRVTVKPNPREVRSLFNTTTFLIDVGRPKPLLNWKVHMDHNIFPLLFLLKALPESKGLYYSDRKIGTYASFKNITKGDVLQFKRGPHKFDF